MRPVSKASGFHRLKNSITNRVSLASLKARLGSYSVCYAEWAEVAYFLSTKLQSKTPIVARLIDPFTHFLNRINFSRIAHVITIGRSPKTYLNIPEEIPLKIIPVSIKNSFFNVKPSSMPDRLNICTVGFRESRKQIYSAIMAVRELRSDLGLDLKFNVVGRGGPDEIYLKVLDEKFPWLTVTRWVDDIASFYKAQNIYLCHSYYESFGVAMVEAMVCGAIPLAHRVLIEDDVLPDKQLYYSSYKELRDKVKHFSTLNEKTRMNIIEQYRMFAQSKYSTSKIAKDILAILEKVSS